MIIWLASYPKSGNTLLRSMLTSYLFSNDGIFNFELLSNVKQYPNDIILEDLKINTDDKNELIKNAIKCQKYFDNKNSVGFVKTHNMLFNFNKKYPFTNLDHTLGTIYIVRDPRNVVLSYARHLDVPIDKIVKFVTTGKILKNDIMGNWAENYTSWKVLNDFDKYLLIKYEELISKPTEIFLKILKFIYHLRQSKFLLNEKKLKNVINSTTLSNLQILEKKNIFKEAVTNKKGHKVKFFDQGGKRDWSNSLDEIYIKNIENTFKDEMKELGYL
ncbi:sulfotransferase domain-containing protein [Candidatus Pelagibacter sp. HIMB1715]|uniref:sulfotransferase domain-containing protein n=1 Tax=Candidatus Pelagibacter sp. HIMB1715 TaxID=3413369 RepID=UPI003F82944B